MIVTGLRLLACAAALFPEIVEKGLAVRDARGNLPYEDAVLDFSNPQTVTWYQEKIAGGRFLPPGDPFAGKVNWTVRRGDRVKPPAAASAR